MFWTGIVIGLFAGTCLGFIFSSFLFAKIESSTEKKLSAATPVEPIKRDVTVSDEFILRYLGSEVIRFDKVSN